MTLSRTERLMAEAGIIALCGCIIAMLGLFTPAETPLGTRMAIWVFGLLIGWVVVLALSQVGNAIAKLCGLSSVWGYVFALPLSAVGITWGILWWTGGSAMAFGEMFARVWPSALLIGIGFFALFFVLYTRADFAPLPETQTKDESEQDELFKKTELHARLPAGFPAILALSVEDHYTRVHAAERSEMVLMSLGEAITLLPEGQGRQIHRSWWAARNAVVSHKREGRDVKLILENDLEVPVSRAQVKPLREAGWLS